MFDTAATIAVIIIRIIFFRFFVVFRFLLIAQRCVLGLSHEVTKYLCNYVNTRVKDYINAQSPVIPKVQEQSTT